MEDLIYILIYRFPSSDTLNCRFKIFDTEEAAHLEAEKLSKSFKCIVQIAAIERPLWAMKLDKVH